MASEVGVVVQHDDRVPIPDLIISAAGSRPDRRGVEGASFPEDRLV